MEAHAVDNADQEERPVRAAFCHAGISAIVDGQEDVGCVSERGEGFFEGERVLCLRKEKGHRGSEENDFGAGVLGKVFAFEVSKNEYKQKFKEDVSKQTYSSQNAITLSVNQSSLSVSMSSLVTTPVSNRCNRFKGCEILTKHIVIAQVWIT